MRKLVTPNKKSKWLWIAALPLAALVLWLVGVGIFRLAPKPVANASTATPPAQLNTAADYLAQGDYELERGNPSQALAAYSRAIELDPASAQAYNNRAYVFMTLQDYAHALPDLDKALALRPDYVNALMNRGDIYNYYYAIDYDRAVADYDRVLAADPDAPAHTSVCGHRLLALQHGWNPGVVGELLTHGAQAGCPALSMP